MAAAGLVPDRHGVRRGAPRCDGVRALGAERHGHRADGREDCLGLRRRGVGEGHDLGRERR